MQAVINVRDGLKEISGSREESASAGVSEAVLVVDAVGKPSVVPVCLHAVFIQLIGSVFVVVGSRYHLYISFKSDTRRDVQSLVFRHHLWR